MKNHTPTPWRAGPINYADIYGADGDLVALVTKGRELTVEDAAYILRACNSHDALVAALTAMLPYYCEHLRGVGADPNDSEIVAQARAALSAAGEVTP